MKLLADSRRTVESFREVGAALRVVAGRVGATFTTTARTGTCERCHAAPAAWPCVCEPTWCESCYVAVLAEQGSS
jgi:hypothetical protein